MRLVPFGEFVPLKQVLFFVGPLVEAVSDFSAGEEPVVFDVDGGRLSVAICYESIYPDLAQAFVVSAPERARELLERAQALRPDDPELQRLLRQTRRSQADGRE